MIKLMLLLALFALLSVTVTFAQATQPPSTESESSLLRFEFNDTSLEDALTELFKTTTYSFVLSLTIDKIAPLNITLVDCTFQQVLQVILDWNDLAYRREGNVYYISRRLHLPVATDAPGENNSAQTMSEWWEETKNDRQASELWRIVERPIAGQRQLLYVSEYGDFDQVRLRTIPFSDKGGGEAILWEAPKGSHIAYLLPSPDFTRALVVWGSAYLNNRLLVITVNNADTLALPEIKSTSWAYWKNPTTLSILSRPGDQLDTLVEYSYELPSKTLTKVAEKSVEGLEPELPFLTQPLRSQLEVFQGLLQDRLLIVPFKQDEAAGALIRGMGLGYVDPNIADIPLAHPCAAVASNSEDIALTTGRSDHAVFVLSRYKSSYGDYVSYLEEVIPLSKLIQNEAVWVSQLQWSSDGKYLLFTETHYHPARFHAPDIGGDFPDPSDWTYLIRMWSKETNQTKTIALGRNAWLLPVKE